MNLITSRDNPQVKALRRLVQDSTGYRKAGRFWLEGDHLCRAATERGVRPEQVVLTESFWAEQGARWADLGDQLIVMPDALFASLSGLESPARMGFVVAWPSGNTLLPDASTVVLDRLQDAGNVGAILRSADACGVERVYLTGFTGTPPRAEIAPSPSVARPTVLPADSPRTSTPISASTLPDPPARGPAVTNRRVSILSRCR